MSPAAVAIAGWLLLATGSEAVAQGPPPAPRVVELKASDGTRLEATYFAAGKPGPGVILSHQAQRTRESWSEVASQLAAAGIHVLTVDSRGKGGSGGGVDDWRTWWFQDLDTAFDFLISQPGVDRNVVGVGGAGGLGVESAVETARRHPSEVKSLVLLSGETESAQLQFLHQSARLPGLFVYSDDDEYPPTPSEMQLLYAASPSPAKKLIHYSTASEAPWLWYETFLGTHAVPATGGHGTDLFQPHPELRDIIAQWFATTLIQTPGQAPADPLAAAPILMDVEFGGGVARARRQLLEARRQDPGVQLWPEVSMTSVGENFDRQGDFRSGIEVFKLNLLAYPTSADVYENIAEAYLGAGRDDLARQSAERCLALLDTPGLPASSWTNTEPYRGEIRQGAEDVLKKLKEKRR